MEKDSKDLVIIRFILDNFFKGKFKEKAYFTRIINLIKIKIYNIKTFKWSYNLKYSIYIKDNGIKINIKVLDKKFIIIIANKIFIMDIGKKD